MIWSFHPPADCSYVPVDVCFAGTLMAKFIRDRRDLNDLNSQYQHRSYLSFRGLSGLHHYLHIFSMSLMLLPDEILLEITKHVFPPWFASMSITSELKELQNAQVLRVNKFFHDAGLQAIRSSFSGEFQRLDRRGRITGDSNVGPWYPWLIQNTTTLHLLDSPSSLWYIDQYWKYYPRLKGFCVTITHDTASYSLTSNIHDLEQRQKRCNRVTANWLNGDLELRQYMWGELRRIWYSMISHDRQCWPDLEIRNITCSCHAFRQTVSVLPRQIKADVV